MSDDFEQDRDRGEEFLRSKKVVPIRPKRKPNAPVFPDKHTYQIKNNAIFRRIGMEGGESVHRLCNFVARIAAEELHDDGEHTDICYVIEGTDTKGAPLPAVAVSSSEFRTMGWVDRLWGARCIIEAGTSTKDHLRAAIQHLSDPTRKTVYKHTGWRVVGGAPAFLHGGGALGAPGNQTDIEVRAGENNMLRYRLPDPPEGEALATAVRASLSLLEIAPEHRHIGAVALATVYRAPLYSILPFDFSIWFSGLYQSYKSELAAQMQAHFGDFTARSFPANWFDTISDLEAKAYATKDAVIVIDDFKPCGGSLEMNRLHAKADHLLRGAGNQAGRGRRTVNMSSMRTYYPRGIIVSTGEDLPRGSSIRARTISVEIPRGGIDRSRLSESQEYARGGLYAAAMAGFVRWLAPQLDTLRESLPAYLIAFREQAIKGGLPPDRGASQLASLLIGLDLFRTFAVECGALSDDHGAVMARNVERYLETLFQDRAAEAADEDETAAFLRLLGSALQSGHCHLADPRNQGPPSRHPHFCGWRAVPLLDADGRLALDGEGNVLTTHKAMGRGIGWATDCELLLDGDATYAVVANLAREQGEPIPFSVRRTWKNLHARGHLVGAGKRDLDGRVRLQIQRRIGGVIRGVYVLLRSMLEEAEES